jgi:hypothetical protein
MLGLRVYPYSKHSKIGITFNFLKGVNDEHMGI